MKSIHKIIIGNTLTIIFIAMVYMFSYHEFDQVLTKLHFVQVADNLNFSFLKMRLEEKNYFLYQVDALLPSIKRQIRMIDRSLNEMKKDIVKAIGEENFIKLSLKLKRYEAAIEKAGTNPGTEHDTEMAALKTGRELSLLFESMIRLERESVNEIILNTRQQILYFFCLVLLMALISSYLFFSKMFRSIRRIEKTANLISKGNFVKIEGKIRKKDELGAAMTAINSMCEELETRQEQLVQSRKLVSLGVLTAGVAHELGNPINNISLVAQTYIEVYDNLGDDDKKGYMGTVLEETERIRKIVQNLLDFSRTKGSDFAKSDINGVVGSSIKLVQNMLDVSKIVCTQEFNENLPPVFIDKGKMQEVFVNILTNSIHAMPSGGEIIARTKSGSPPNMVNIEIEDNGEGIPAESLAHIFDPFFSTKGVQGTGLGLSISYGIIKKHNGRIDVRSNKGKGTTFIIELPIHIKGESEHE